MFGARMKNTRQPKSGRQGCSAPNEKAYVCVISYPWKRMAKTQRKIMYCDGSSEARILFQGAEARVYSVEMYGEPAVAKERFSKGYRALALDSRLRKERTVQEARCLGRCRQIGVSTPAIYMVDTSRYVIYMEQIPGLTAKAYIEKFRENTEAVSDLMRKLGRIIAKIHDAGLTHGDLTTSNFICRRPDDDAREASYFEDIVVIDFGLGGTKSQPEDKAVDLYVLERALISTHRDSQSLLNLVLEEYASSSSHATPVLRRLEAVRARGRKRECFG